MKVAFFNYLPLEYGGGLAAFYRSLPPLLHNVAPDHTYAVVTCTETFAQKISRLYSFYYRKPQYTTIRESKQTITTTLNDVIYLQGNSLQTLRQLLASYDVIYTKNDFLELLLLWFFRKSLRGKHIIIGYHTPLLYAFTSSWQAKFHNLLYDSFLYRFLIKQGTSHHALTQETKKILMRWHVTQVTTLPQPFDFNAYKKLAKRKTKIFKRRKGKTHIIWSGRLTEQKGITDLLTIIEKMLQTTEGKSIVWVIAGTGEYVSAVTRVASKSSQVVYLGYVPQHEMASVYSRGDLYISTSKWENIPYTFLEASSFALPIISYHLPGIQELVPKRYGMTVSTIPEFIDTIRLMVRKKRPMKAVRSHTFTSTYANELLLKKYLQLFFPSR